MPFHAAYGIAVALSCFDGTACLHHCPCIAVSTNLIAQPLVIPVACDFLMAGSCVKHRHCGKFTDRQTDFHLTNIPDMRSCLCRSSSQDTEEHTTYDLSLSRQENFDLEKWLPYQLLQLYNTFFQDPVSSSDICFRLSVQYML